MPLLSEDHRRKRNLVIITAVLIVLAAGSAVNYGLTGPDLPVASNLAMILLFNLNAVVLLLLVVLLFRNLVKLWFERQQKVVASKFKAKLVLAFLFLSLVPTLLIILIASTIINRSIDGGFKPQVERPLDQALAVAQAYYQNLEFTALRHAQQIAHVVTRDNLLDTSQRTGLRLYLAEQQQQLGLGGVTVLIASGKELAHVKDPALADLPLRSVGETQLKRGMAGHEVTSVREVDSVDLVDAVTPIWSRQEGTRSVDGLVVVSTHVPERLEAKVRGVSQAFKEYKQLRLLRTPIKVNLILFFILITLIVVFCFTWFGLYLARGITGPIEQLVEGTREVAAGNLNYKVQTRADDEIGVLVDSFNRMTDDLSLSKHQLEEAYLDLQDKHTELEERRRYIETVLEAITTGVVSFDAVGRLTTINGAAARMFDLSEETSVGRLLEDVFQGSEGHQIVSLVRRAQRTKVGAAAAEVTRERTGTRLSLLASVTALRGPEGEYGGAVVVFDDLTELIQAQRQAAWREVAQRLAHEIKNPLTPIQLSAQRLRRRLARQTGDAERLVTECTEIIIQEVDGLKRLVEEFSRFARMPAVIPRPTDIRPIIESIASLYRESHPTLNLLTRHAEALPELEVDPDHLKRAVLNLVDNAVDAVSGVGEVVIETQFLEEGGRARIAVADDGQGISAADQEKVFTPYFSTKVAGMGLGLPIVHHIVTEHRGTIRVEPNLPRGSRFIIEVPVARGAVPVEAQA
jgi:two-component system, NtrC family, nitrogen regulation sensor histidine kinase NtrY